MAQIILVTSGKGGVGKSVVSAWLGQALAVRGCSVALIEGSHRSLDVLFGVSEGVLFDLKDLLEGRCDVDDALLSVGDTGGLRLLCGTLDGSFDPEPERLQALCKLLSGPFEVVLVEVDGANPAHLAAWAAAAGRAVIVSTADPVSARAGRSVSDALDAAGIRDIRLCVNLLPADFGKTRPVPDLDWMIDNVCAQLISVVPFEKFLAAPVQFGKKNSLSNVPKMIFDNFAQRILGNYIDLLVQ